MKLKYLSSRAIVGLAPNQAAAEDITTLGGQTFTAVKGVSLKPGGLFFVVGTGATRKESVPE